MSLMCNDIHQLFVTMKRYRFPFDESELPKNGIYILFEKGEIGHNAERIVRVGTHTGEGRLVSRLKEHFLKENKDRSIFRKNIGRAILAKNNDVFLEQWNWDLTTRENRDRLLPLLDTDQQKQIEKKVTSYIQEHFSFVIFEVSTKDDRMDLESKIISTISLCQDCIPSDEWLGNSSPVQKIRKSGLWLVQGLYKTPLNKDETLRIQSIC